MQEDDQDVARRQHRGDDRVAQHPKVAHVPEYTAAMPVDIAAEVIGNDRLSSDYNVVGLSAPAIAAAAAPGQFVMVKAGRGHDPLLRRPFSVFEVLARRTTARPSASRS